MRVNRQSSIHEFAVKGNSCYHQVKSKLECHLISDQPFWDIMHLLDKNLAYFWFDHGKIPFFPFFPMLVMLFYYFSSILFLFEDRCTFHLFSSKGLSNNFHVVNIADNTLFLYFLLLIIFVMIQVKFLFYWKS